MKKYVFFTSIFCSCAFLCSAQEDKNLVFLDTRDANEYSYLKVDDLMWFTQNLRFKTPSSMCVSTDEERCATCGEFYLLEDAFDVCPNGWRLPNLKEVQGLLKLEKRKKIHINELLRVELCGRIDNKTIAKVGLQNTFWIDAPEKSGHVEHWHTFTDEQKIHKHNVVAAKRQFPVRCVCDVDE